MVGALLVGQLAAGCLSNEYRIPPDELARVVRLPPANRGSQVRIVQEWGSDREVPLPPPPPALEPPPGEPLVAEPVLV